MAKQLLSEAIRDTATYTTAQQTDDYDGDVVFQIVNDLDAEITVEYVGTHGDDGDFTDGVTLASTTVAAGGRAYDTLTDSWEMIQVKVTASTSPTANDCTVYFMS